MTFGDFIAPAYAEGPSQTSTPSVKPGRAKRLVQQLHAISPVRHDAIPAEFGLDEDDASSHSIIGSQIPENQDDDLDLHNWDLPTSAIEYYQEKGMTKMFKWQRDCLRTPGVLNGHNLVFSAPTSAGKTLVADIIIMKQGKFHITDCLINVSLQFLNSVKKYW